MRLRGPSLYPTATQQFLDENRTSIRTTKGRRSWARILHMLQDLNEGKRVNEFTEQDLVTFCQHRFRGGPKAAAPLSPNTMLTRRTALMSFYSWAHWKGMVTTDPSANLKRLVKAKSKNVRPAHWLSEHQVGAILRTCSGESPIDLRDRVLLSLGFFTGLRREEFCHLLWSHVDLDARTLYLGAWAKGEKPATIGLPRQLVDVLLLWRQCYVAALGRPAWDDPILIRVRRIGGATFGQPQRRILDWDTPLGEQGVCNIVRARGMAIGIDSLAPHDMRRTFAGLLEAKGKRIEDISKALRHENIGTTQRYLEQNPARRLEVVEDFELDLGAAHV